jgi:hypothetical protein
MLVAEARNMPLVANARMYSTGAAQAAQAWVALLRWIVARAGGAWNVLDYPPPQPLDELWARGDLGCTFMCGLPYALDARQLTPIVAYEGRPIYFTDIVVHRDAPFHRLEDTFGRRVGYTVKHSQSGYVALREHLLPYRLRLGHPLYASAVGPLGGARDVVDAILTGRIDVGPLDSYVLDLIRKPAARSRSTIAIDRHHAGVADPAVHRDRFDRSRLGQKIARRLCGGYGCRGATIVA